MTPISRFEALAQRLIEGSLSRLLGGRLEPLEVATRVAQAMEDSRRRGIKAAVYHVYLQPDDHAALAESSADLPDSLAAYVTELAQRSGVTVAAPVTIVLTPDPSLRPRQIMVATTAASTVGQETQIYAHNDDGAEVLARLREVDAYLIISGKRHVPLRQPLVTIGRRTDNDIVIEAPTVSRKHAQLRWRYGRFILYDLNSRGGTTVNGQPVDEAVLQPGDVIMVSNVPLIYGEGIAGRESFSVGTGATQPFIPDVDDERP